MEKGELDFLVGSYNSQETFLLVSAESSKIVQENKSLHQESYHNADEALALINATSSKTSEEPKTALKNYSTWKEYEVFCLIEGNYDFRNFPKDAPYKKKEIPEYNQKQSAKKNKNKRFEPTEVFQESV